MSVSNAFARTERQDFRGAANRRNVATRFSSRYQDGEFARWAFIGLLIGSLGVVALDLADLVIERAWQPASPATAARVEAIATPIDQPNLPARNAPGRVAPSTDTARLDAPIAFQLRADGVLIAEGTIDRGAADRFAAEIDAFPTRITTVSFNSPGGALDEAIAIARLIRDHRIATEIPDGGICASSCPLAFAGGVARMVGAAAAVGVHQFYAATALHSAPSQAMADAQTTTARITRHLVEMGVDPGLWLHALDTPPQQLYYLSPRELMNYRLVTRPVEAASAIGVRRG